MRFRLHLPILLCSAHISRYLLVRSVFYMLYIRIIQSCVHRTLHITAPQTRRHRRRRRRRDLDYGDDNVGLAATAAAALPFFGCHAISMAHAAGSVTPNTQPPRKAHRHTCGLWCRPIVCGSGSSEMDKVFFAFVVIGIYISAANTPCLANCNRLGRDYYEYDVIMSTSVEATKPRSDHEASFAVRLIYRVLLRITFSYLILADFAVVS